MTFYTDLLGITILLYGSHRGYQSTSKVLAWYLSKLNLHLVQQNIFNLTCNDQIWFYTTKCEHQKTFNIIFLATVLI